MALRASYYGIKRQLKTKITDIAGAWDDEVRKTADNSKGYVDLIDDTVGWVNKNLCPKYTSYHTGQDVTYTADSNGVVTCSGTASDTAVWRQSSITLPAGSYILSGGEGIGAYNTSDYKVLIALYDPTASAYIAPDAGTVDRYTFAYNKEVRVTIRIQKGVNSSGYTFYPMIRKADILDDRFVPYSTDKAVKQADYTTMINAILSAATEAADFAAFKAAMSAITPLTRSIPSGSDERSLQDITPEDVPEEVIEEPVTKKRTTKKTVKEGE